MRAVIPSQHARNDGIGVARAVTSEAPPGDVLVGPYQKKLITIDSSKFRLLKLHYLQRQAAPCRNGHECLTRSFAEASQREPWSKAIKDRCAISHEYAGHAHAGWGCRHVAQWVVRDLRARFIADHRRVGVGVAKFDAKALVLGVTDCRDAPPCFGTRRVGPSRV